MPQKKKTDYHEFEFGDKIENLNACSTTDCTGVMWRAPKDEEELQSYMDVYDFEPPQEKNRVKRPGPGKD